MLVWTKTPPREPGWYWCLLPLAAPFICELVWSRQGGWLCMRRSGEPLMSIASYKDQRARWSGPIPEPSEERRDGERRSHKPREVSWFSKGRSQDQRRYRPLTMRSHESGSLRDRRFGRERRTV